MKRPVAIMTFATMTALHAQAKQPLEIAFPDGWTCEYKSQMLGMIHSYTLAKNPVESGCLSLFGCPPMKQERISEALHRAIQEIVEKMEITPEAPFTITGHAIMEFQGDYFSGPCVAFTVEETNRALLLRFFILSNEEQTWMGQFVGSEKGWGESSEILKQLKPTV